MRIEKIKCPKCKQIIEYNPEIDKIRCNFCGIDINLSEAIEDIEKDKNYLLAEKYLNEEFEYEKAYYIYKELAEKYPDNPKSWFGILRASTLDFEYIQKNMKDLVQTYYLKFQETETSETFKEEIALRYKECQIKSKKSYGLTINQLIFIVIVIIILIIAAIIYFSK